MARQTKKDKLDNLLMDMMYSRFPNYPFETEWPDYLKSSINDVSSTLLSLLQVSYFFAIKDFIKETDGRTFKKLKSLTK